MSTVSIKTSVSPNHTYSFQELEKQQETGWNSFKWRNYDPAIGRFFNVDPLSEKYAYQSHYNFSENRVVDGRELEGLEKVQVNEEEPLLQRMSNGFNDFLKNVSNYFGEISNVDREVKMSKNSSMKEELSLEKRSGKSSALAGMANGLSETIKGGAYAWEKLWIKEENIPQMQPLQQHLSQKVGHLFLYHQLNWYLILAGD